MNLLQELIRSKLTGSGGGGSAVLIEKEISSNGTYYAKNDDADGYGKVAVSVANSYAAGDEGKVVSGGALVAQSSDTVTSNGTVDTTLINSLTVNVGGGADLSALEIYIADFVADPPTVTDGALDGWRRCVVS